MAVRPGVGVVSQIGVETTPGVAVAANRFLPTLSFKLARDIQTKNYRAMGSKVNTSKSQGKKMAKGSFDGVMDYNSIVYILAGLFPSVVSAIGTSGGYGWVFSPGSKTSDMARKTFTTEIGDETAGEKYSYTQLTSFGFDATQDDVNVKGNAIARYPLDNITMTASPTARTERPVDRDDIDLYMDNTYLGLGTTKITEAMAEALDLADKFKEVFFHNRVAGQFADVIEVPYEGKFSFETAHNAQSRALIAEINDNPLKYIRWQATGNTIGLDGATEIYEFIRFDMALRFDSPEPLGDPEAPYGYKYNCEMVFDPTMGGHLQIIVTNKVASL